MAEDEDQDSKTEEPSERKLSKAREEGQIPVSNEVKVWASLLGVIAIVSILSPQMAGQLKVLLLPLLDHPDRIATDESSLRELLGQLSLGVGLVLAPPMALLMALAVFASVAQAGLMLTPSRLLPDLSRINPMAGLGRMFSSRSLVELLKGVTKLVVVGAIVFAVAWPKLKNIEVLLQMDLITILIYIRDTLLSMTAAVVIIMTFLAGADWWYQRHTFRKQLRMTKQEIKDEYKDSEGDPKIKGKIRQLRMERARRRMMQQVPAATVVVTNPTHYAVALKYEQEEMNAPRLVAKGADLIAKRIREMADENDVPIVENPPLARALFATVELDQEIPAEHYKAVAEVIGYVMRLKGHLGQ